MLVINLIIEFVGIKTFHGTINIASRNISGVEPASIEERSKEMPNVKPITLR